MINYLLLLIISLLARGPGYTGSSGEAGQPCLECHGSLMETKFTHPQLETTCDICHSPTGEEHPGSGKPGFTLAEEVPGLCYFCHTDYTEEEGAHAPAKEGYCLICHAPHGSDEKYLITAKTAELCFGCHTETEEESKSSMIIHKPFTDQVACSNCHYPHSSATFPLLRDEANSLCLGCHNKTLQGDSTTISNISRLLQRSKTIHLPVVQGGCIMCHEAHYAGQHSLLNAYYNPEHYAEATLENFELCFLCHDTELMEARETEYGTNFRNGNLNLHAVHINGEKGRGCSMCHDVHAAPGDRLMVNTIQFASWPMKMDFRLTENGGTCATGCHAKKEYDRLNPVDNIR